MRMYLFNMKNQHSDFEETLTYLTLKHEEVLNREEEILTLFELELPKLLKLEKELLEKIGNWKPKE